MFRSPANARHGNKILNIGQHVFTSAGLYGNAHKMRKIASRSLESGSNSAFCIFEQTDFALSAGLQCGRYAGCLIFQKSRAGRLLRRSKRLETWMNATKTIPFCKTAACPSSATLLQFRNEKLATEVSRLVRNHLQACDFCQAEVTLLAHHHRQSRHEDKVPEIPMNLRVLAESILFQGGKSLRRKASGVRKRKFQFD